MALPVSKSALDRLGARIAASNAVSDDDLAELARVVGAYQDVLNGVKVKLTELGYQATTRMKTTGTLADKLRRETARLSQVQDLAGARIVVPDRSAQDEATSIISGALESAGCTWRVIDRRENPSHGYRAVHLIVQVDKVPVEIQIRTDLQDGWAQLVERLADVWGRGIRYGDEPDAPDSVVGSGAARTRRDVVSMLMQLSDAIARVEERRMSSMKAAAELARAESMVDVLEVPSGAGTLIVGDTMPRDIVSVIEQSLGQIQEANSEAGALMAGWQRMTIAQFTEATRAMAQIARRDRDRRESELCGLETALKDILSQLAGAIGLG